MNKYILRWRSDELGDVMYDFMKEVSGVPYLRNPNWKEMFEAHIRIHRFINFSIRKDEEMLTREYLDE